MALDKSIQFMALLIQCEQFIAEKARKKKGKWHKWRHTLIIIPFSIAHMKERSGFPAPAPVLL